MYKKLLIAISASLVLFLVVVAFQPSEFRVERSIVIDAPPEVVFNHVNDYHIWQEWSPWAKLDPEAKGTYEGPANGVGSKFNWAGNDKVGEGNMTITESTPPSRILMQLNFLKPMQATNFAEFTFAPEDGKTKMTWAMTGKNGFVGKAFCLVMNMDKMVGADFERGLTQLKAMVEGGVNKEAPQS